MCVDRLARCLDEAFGSLAPPPTAKLAGARCTIEESFLTAVTGKTWQQLRPLIWYIPDATDIVLLSADAYRYYLPAYLYALIEKENDGWHLDGILNSLWYEGLYYDSSYHRELWDERMPLLTKLQKQCIAHFLVHILRRTDDLFLREGSNRSRIERMLKKYWNAQL
jgi:hypothetical protein